MIVLLLGPMMSGKSSELLRLAERATFAKKTAVIVRPRVDNRGYFTHGKLEPRVPVEVLSIEEIPCRTENYDEVYVDEAQFFEPDRFYDVALALGNRKKLTVAALNGDSDQRPWETVQRLIPIADDIRFFTGVCVDCGSEYGAFTYYLGEIKDKVKVGGSEQYACLCRGCLERRHSSS